MLAATDSATLEANILYLLRESRYVRLADTVLNTVISIQKELSHIHCLAVFNSIGNKTIQKKVI